PPFTAKMLRPEIRDIRSQDLGSQIRLRPEYGATRAATRASSPRPGPPPCGPGTLGGCRLRRSFGVLPCPILGLPLLHLCRNGMRFDELGGGFDQPEEFDEVLPVNEEAAARHCAGDDPQAATRPVAGVLPDRLANGTTGGAMLQRTMTPTVRLSEWTNVRRGRRV